MARRRKRRSQKPSSAQTGTGEGKRQRPLIRQEFNPDYSHVIQDLRRIAILTSSFLVILVILSFILK